MLYLALLGLRWGEIAALRVENLDFVRDTIRVARQRTRGAHGGMIEQEPKTRAGRRSLSVPKPIMEMLAAHLSERGITARYPEALLFVSDAGEPLHYSNWRRRVWVPARNAAKLGDLTFHDLKHTAATLLVEEGVDVKTAQVRLGHANPHTTLRIYAQVPEQTDRAAATKVGNRFRTRSRGSRPGSECRSGGFSLSLEKVEFVPAPLRKSGAAQRVLTSDRHLFGALGDWDLGDFVGWQVGQRLSRGGLVERSRSRNGGS